MNAETDTGTFRGSDEIILTAQKWVSGGRQVALATVVKTWGSSPRPVGSQLAVNELGEFFGSVSGGCIEGDVIREALEVIQDGKARLLDFGVADAEAWEVGLSCGGEVHIHLQRADKDYLDKLATIRPQALLTNLNSGAYTFLDQVSSAPLHEAALTAIIEDKSRIVEDAGNEVFIHVLNLPLRMIIVGAVHIAQALAPMAAIAGFSVSIVDPRRAFATAERFPGAQISTEWPDDALTELKPDSRTAVVTLSHDPKIDDPALHVALRSEAFYVGCLGSRRTHAKRIERLTEEGYSAAEIGRINAPAGLDLGSKSPAEIAVSVLGEVIAAKYGKRLHADG